VEADKLIVPPWAAPAEGLSVSPKLTMAPAENPTATAPVAEKPPVPRPQRASIILTRESLPLKAWAQPAETSTSTVEKNPDSSVGSNVPPALAHTTAAANQIPADVATNVTSTQVGAPVGPVAQPATLSTTQSAVASMPGTARSSAPTQTVQVSAPPASPSTAPASQSQGSLSNNPAAASPAPSPVSHFSGGSPRNQSGLLAGALGVAVFLGSMLAALLAWRRFGSRGQPSLITRGMCQERR
jgi:hypothetical protein